MFRFASCVHVHTCDIILHMYVCVREYSCIFVYVCVCVCERERERERKERELCVCVCVSASVCVYRCRRQNPRRPRDSDGGS